MPPQALSQFNLGTDGTIIFRLSESAKRLLIEFYVDEKGLTKAGVNGLIDALRRVRDQMAR